MIRIIESSLNKYPELCQFLAETDVEKQHVLVSTLKSHYHLQASNHYREFNRFFQVPEILIRLDLPSHLENFLKHQPLTRITRNELLDAATQARQIKIIRVLLKQPGFIDEMSNTGLSAFQIAAEQGDEELVELFLTLPTVLKDLTTNKNFAFCAAARKGHYQLVQKLLTFPQIADQITISDNFALRWAYANDHQNVVSLLLQQPSVFAFAEKQHLQGGSKYLQKFVQNWLDDFQQRKLNTPENKRVFTEGEVKTALLIVHYLIQKNQTQSFPLINELLTLPQIMARAHLPLINKHGNELLELSRSINNEEITALLLSFPSVRRVEMSNPLNLPVELSKESAMRALTKEEEYLLTHVIDHYQEQIDNKGGTRAVLHSFIGYLENRYRCNPAFITINKAKILLPLEWKAFQDLIKSQELTEVQHKEALSAYYKHSHHTVWRFFCIPNPWMAPSANYVLSLPKDQGSYADYESNIDIIAVQWLAASDVDTPSIAPYTIADRVEHFIKSLALMARAHDWDYTRINKDGFEEEYDDYNLGDEPTCPFGIRRRAFEAVVGHPLLNALTPERLKTELREFIRSYYQQQLQVNNRQEFIQMVQYCINNPSAAVPERLLNFNIPTAEQEYFKTEIKRKFPTQIEKYPKILNNIDKRFFLNKGESHFLKFYNQAYLGSLIENPNRFFSGKVVAEAKVSETARCLGR